MMTSQCFWQKPGMNKSFAKIPRQNNNASLFILAFLLPLFRRLFHYKKTRGERSSVIRSKCNLIGVINNINGDRIVDNRRELRSNVVPRRGAKFPEMIVAATDRPARPARTATLFEISGRPDLHAFPFLSFYFLFFSFFPR